MHERRAHYAQLMNGFSQRLGLTTEPEDGLFLIAEANGSRWSVELNEDSDLIYISTSLFPAEDKNTLKTALEINQNVELLRGAFLGLSQTGDLQLNAQATLQQTDDIALENTLVNLMQIREQVCAQFSELKSSSTSKAVDPDWSATSIRL
ncbi:type III secretion system chaperone [Pseudovibrio sp. Tun.PSC04-5.I4]|uniref:type III secretion system chaperone n=1 Tax=Pseudovibrio sp. Tun.PSC04-5.I4 TaxID=1798213 RepID=UPI000888B834|nr:type III secretion system chaperone [Pseudovibrio sp. Tun.PSC04-5.I4]SDR08926.1 Tir chaperone protein (CesT) family protein [Pseudovibrio sp. Tun.PSC04-5.I4]